MPTPMMKKLSHQTHVPKKELEHVWKDVTKSVGDKKGYNKYAVATSVVEKYAHKHAKKD